MRARIGLCVLVAVVTASCVTSRRIRRIQMTELTEYSTPTYFSVERNRYQLPNGMTVILVPDARTNLARVTVRYSVGSLEDPDGMPGLAHLVEHMTFELGPERPFLSDRLAVAVLDYNATTSWDTTEYFSTALSGQLDELIALEAERLGARCEQLDETVLQREIDIVRSEIRQRATVAAAANQLVRADAYGPEHPYTRGVSGTETKVSAMKLEDVCRFIETYYAPERAVLIVSGKFDEGAVVDRIRETFGKIPARETPVREHAPRVVLQGTDSTHTLPIRKATALVVTPGSVFTDKQGISDGLLASLLQRDLRKQAVAHDYIADISVGGAGGRRAPLLVVGISVDDPKRLKEAVDWFFSTRDGILGRFDYHYADAIKVAAITSMLRGMDSLFVRDALIGAYEQFGTAWLTLERALALSFAILPSELFDRADSFFARSSTHVVYLYPDPDDEAVQDRASLEQVALRSYDIGAWRAKVDLNELERDLELPARKVELKTRRFELDNGLRVVLVPDFVVPMAEIRLVFPGGYLHEPDEHPGLAFATAWLLDFDLEGHFWPKDRIYVASALRGAASIRTSVSATRTTFSSTPLADSVESTLWALSFLLEQGRHSKKYLKELNELLARELDEDERVSERQTLTIRRALYGEGHAFAAPGINKKNVEKLTMLALRAYRDTFYRSRGATLVVVGKFDPVTIETHVRQLFSSWKDHGKPPEAPTIPDANPTKGTRYFALVEEGTSQLRIGLAFTTTRSKGKRIIAVELLGEMLELRMSSLREQLASTYGISVSNTQRRGPGELLVFGAMDAERGAQAFEAMQSIMQEVRDGKQLEEAFLLSRRRLLQRWLADAHDTESIAARFARAPTATAADYERVAERIAQMRLADVQTVIDEDLASGVVVLVGPKSAIDAAYSAAGITDIEILE